MTLLPLLDILTNLFIILSLDILTIESRASTKDLLMATTVDGEYFDAMGWRKKIRHASGVEEFR